MSNPLDLLNLLNILATVLFLAATLLLFLHRKTVWTLLALCGQAASVLFRLLILVMPAAYTDFALLRVVWSAAGLAVALGLAGYAWTEFDAARRARGVAAGVAP